jgi:hypothetical protein
MLPAQARRGSAVGDLHFLQQIFDVLARGESADAESACDLFVGSSRAEESEDFIFSSRQTPFRNVWPLNAPVSGGVAFARQPNTIFVPHSSRKIRNSPYILFRDIRRTSALL